MAIRERGSQMGGGLTCFVPAVRTPSVDILIGPSSEAAGESEPSEHSCSNQWHSFRSS